MADAPPETLLVESRSNGQVARCLGVLVAPRVAITASHCVEGRSRIGVRIVRSENRELVAVERLWLDTRQRKDRETVDNKTADVAVLVLSRPIALASYPEVARRPAPGWIAATGLRWSGDHLETMALSLRPPLGSPYYVSQPFARPGDSGGGVFFIGPSGDRMVVAVTAGGSAQREVLTRVDLVAEAIDQAIQMASSN